MLAVIKTGGKQYKVNEGTLVTIEKLPEEVGTKINITDVLMIENDGKTVIGAPFIEGAVVTATVVEQKRNKKILIFKKSRRKNYRRKNGHRQPVTILKIEEIKH